MANDKIYYDDKAKDATLTVSTEETSFEKEYAVDNSPSTKWRTTVITSSTLLFDLGTATNIKAIAYFGTNIESGDTTFTITAGSTTACSDESQALTKATKGFYELDWTYRYFKLTIVKASGDYIEIGKVGLLGNEYQFIRAYDWGYPVGKQSVYDESEGRYGQGNIQERFNRFIANISFNYLSKTQRDIFYNDVQPLGYLYYYYDDDSEIFYGIGKWSLPVHKKGNIYSMNLAFTELK